jgi:signal transduction histidine kinase
VRSAIARSARATGLLVSGAGPAAAALLGLFAAATAAIAVATVVGLALLPELVQPVRAAADVERRRAARVAGWEIPAPYRPAEGPRRRRARTILRDPATRRDLLWMLVDGVLGLPAAILAVLLWPSALFSLSVPLWWWAAPRGSVSAFVALTSWPEAATLPIAQAALSAALLWWLVPRLADRQLRLAGRLLGPLDRAELERRVQQLTESRAGALEAHAAELRRIERDLHDGTQAHLVSVAVRLGLAERSFTTQPETSLKLLREAMDGIEDVLSQLRSVIRGVYPPILADRGLAGAIAGLAAGLRIPVTVEVPPDLPRLPAAVEAAAYYVTAEALTNVSKHSGATRATVRIDRPRTALRTALRIAVQDDGAGGADPGRGSGLSGIRRRVAALDGSTEIRSPAGQGTTIEVELPCD